MRIKGALILLSVFVLAACGKGKKENENNVPEESKQDIPTEKCQDPAYHFDRKVDPTEEKDGLIVYQCGICGYMKEEVIPKLSNENYTVEELTYNCAHGNGKRYTSEQYGTYEVTDNMRSKHKVYGDVCEVCGQLVGEFKFSNFSTPACAGYPRLYQLSNYWENAWFLGGDNGRIVLRRSFDQGLTWTKEEVIASMNGYALANVDFFELPNHDIICSFRAIGNSTSTKNNRKLHFAISSDGGETWVDGGDIVDNYILGESLGYTSDQVTTAMTLKNNIGFYEPYVDFINNVPTVMYADDFTPMLIKAKGASVSLNYATQYLMSQTYDMDSMKWSTERKIVMDGTKEKSPTDSGLAARISRDGMPVYARMKDGTYVLVFEGTYRDSDYHSYTGEPSLSEYHPFEIMLSYSKDGVNWSNPVEIYTPHNNRSKSSAPFICVTDDDRLVVSFQTDEDAVLSDKVGDSYSVMKCMISKPGVKIEDIRQDSFYGVNNVNNTPVGSGSLWNGMMLLGNKLYTCSTGCRLRVSEIPVYADEEEYKDLEIAIEGQESVVALNSSSFTAYSSSNSISPAFSEGKLILDNETHAEQKLIINELEVGEQYQIDFTLESVSDRDVNFGFYLGAVNPANDSDKITALNIHLERAVGSLSWSTHLYDFNQAYAGQLGTSMSKTSESNTIKVRIIVKNQAVKVLIDDMTKVVNEYEVPNQYDLTGKLGLRNQGLSKATISNLKITKAIVS